jgi:hypothetical protein
MNATVEKSLFASMPAWSSSLLTAALSLFAVFVFAGIGYGIGRLFGFSYQELEANAWYGNFMAHILTGITVAIMCYFICKAHPKSVWYTPILCNAMTLWAGLGNYFIHGGSFMLYIVPFGMGWMLSVAASIWGAKRSKL